MPVNNKHGSAAPASGRFKMASESIEEKKNRKKQIRETVEAVAIALVLALIIRAFVIQAFKIPSGSMEDTLLIGDHIIVSKFAYGMQVPRPAMIEVFGLRVPFLETKLYNTWGSIERGDVVVFRFPGDRSKDYIKRAIGLPGDRVEINHRVIYINGKQMDDPFGVFKNGAGMGFDKMDSFGPITVPEGDVFVMGDNRDRSFDSRYWGTVPIYDIKGKAFIIYWSWDGNGSWIRFKRIGQLIR